jgi:hypothetical protein
MNAQKALASPCPRRLPSLCVSVPASPRRTRLVHTLYTSCTHLVHVLYTPCTRARISAPLFRVFLRRSSPRCRRGRRRPIGVGPPCGATLSCMYWRVWSHPVLYVLACMEPSCLVCIGVYGATLSCMYWRVWSHPVLYVLACMEPPCLVCIGVYGATLYCMYWRVWSHPVVQLPHYRGLEHAASMRCRSIGVELPPDLAMPPSPPPLTPPLACVQGAACKDGVRGRRRRGGRGHGVSSASEVVVDVDVAGVAMACLQLLRWWST